ncbi:MAG: hypothetical protein U5J83_07605 [Bryobacterales bacterium]|nr:hypothetical protein [Bryobacterales bacterium]
MPAKTPIVRLPLPFDQWSERYPFAESNPDIARVLDGVKVPSQVVEEFRPLAECLEWRLSALYWDTAGVMPFLDSEVPFLINNTGRLSENVAALLFANCLDAGESLESEIRVVEFGAGTGLFARFMLDSFQQICQQEGRDFYTRLRFLVTDRSPATLRQWEERGVFRDHIERVETLVCDAASPEALLAKPVRAVFCNYLLDVLPSTVLKLASDGEVLQLMVRTHLLRTGPATDGEHLSLDEIRAHAASSEAGALHALLPLLNDLDMELAFQPVPDPLRTDAEKCLAVAEGPAPTVMNYGALHTLHVVTRALAPGGFVLLNDYGYVGGTETLQLPGTQRFGNTIALPLNFPVIEKLFASSQLEVLAAEGDERLGVHSRLLSGGAGTRTTEAYHSRFSEEAWKYFQEPVESARRHLAARRLQEALEAYQSALSRSPRNWELIGEVADFLAVHLRDFDASLQLARAALERNPMYSSWLWNVLGDALYCKNQFREAHQAYLQAERIDPSDGRTNLNLAYTFLHFGEHQSALQAIAQGLSGDKRGLFRERLLDKQQQALGAITSTHEAQQAALARRHQRFLDAT